MIQFLRPLISERFDFGRFRVSRQVGRQAGRQEGLTDAIGELTHRSDTGLDDFVCDSWFKWQTLPLLPACLPAYLLLVLKPAKGRLQIFISATVSTLQQAESSAQARTNKSVVLNKQLEKQLLQQQQIKHKLLTNRHEIAFNFTQWMSVCLTDWCTGQTTDRLIDCLAGWLAGLQYACCRATTLHSSALTRFKSVVDPTGSCIFSAVIYLFIDRSIDRPQLSISIGTKEWFNLREISSFTHLERRAVVEQNRLTAPARWIDRLIGSNITFDWCQLILYCPFASAQDDHSNNQSNNRSIHYSFNQTIIQTSGRSIDQTNTLDCFVCIGSNMSANEVPHLFKFVRSMSQQQQQQQFLQKIDESSIDCAGWLAGWMLAVSIVFNLC